MLTSYKRKANIAGAVWLVGSVVLTATVVGMHGNIWDNGNVAAQLILIVSAIAWFYALGAYAMAKGHSAWWAIAGMLSVIGLIVVLALADRHSELA